MKRLKYGGAALVPMAVPTNWRKYLSMNERFLFFRMFSSHIPIVWGLGEPGGGLLACNFMECSTDSLPSSSVKLVKSNVTSALTKMSFSGRGVRDSRSCRKC